MRIPQSSDGHRWICVDHAGEGMVRVMTRFDAPERVRVPQPLAKGQVCTMEAVTLTSSAPRVLRRGLASAFVRRARDLCRVRVVGQAWVSVRVEPSIRVDPSVIDAADWLEWGKKNLTPLEYERRRHAVEVDRLANQRAVV
jgi:hypothetical protein